MKVIVSRFEDIQEIFQDEYSATRIADGIRTETQELLTIDGIESVYVVFIKIPLQVFVSTNGWDIDIVAAKKKYNELLLEYKDEIIRQINNKKVLRAHWKKKTIQESYNGECLKEVERLVETIKAADFKKKKKELDKEWLPYRVNHISWWKEEMASNEEMEEGLRNLSQYNNEVDFIISHCCATSTQKQFVDKTFSADSMTDYLELVKQRVNFKKWFFGHYHDNKNIGPKEILIYEQIIRIL